MFASYEERIDLSMFGIGAEDVNAADEQIAMVEFCQLRMEGNRAAWVYLKIVPSKYIAFKAAYSDGGQSNILEYGEVLFTGWGVNPPSYIIEEMQDKYGISPSFEQDLTDKFKNIFEEA